MNRKRLIFFVTADPAADPSAVATAYHFARAAAGADLDAEVRLAGDAVLIADPAYVAGVDGAESWERVDAAADRPVDVTVCPRSVDARGIRPDQLTGIGARPRPLSDILVEVAEGTSVLVCV
jgi:sulfur relay (sulfurtransferase) complex TusBCD TusD component (DsrE family)